MSGVEDRADGVIEEASSSESSAEEVSSTAVSTPPLLVPPPPVRVVHPVRGVQRAMKGRGTKENPYVLGFSPTRCVRRPRVPSSSPYDSGDSRRVSRRISSRDPSVVGKSHSSSPDEGELHDGVDVSHSPVTLCLCRAGRTLYVAQMASQPLGWGIGYQHICLRDPSDERGDVGVVGGRVDGGGQE